MTSRGRHTLAAAVLFCALALYDWEVYGIAYFPLRNAERAEVEQVVMAEAGGEGYKGQMLVCECILNAAQKHSIGVAEAIRQYKYTPNRKAPSASVRAAVSAVFDAGQRLRDERITLFYNAAFGTSSFHESQVFILAEGNHRFFKEE